MSFRTTGHRPYVSVVLEDNEAVLYDNKGRELVASSDHWYVIQEAIDVLGTGPVSTRGGTIIFSPGYFKLNKPLEIKHRRPIIMKGAGGRGADGDWGLGTILELTSGSYDVFIDARIDRNGPYDNDLVIKDIVLRPLYYAKFGVVTHNYKLHLSRVFIKGAFPDAPFYAGFVCAGNGPHTIIDLGVAHCATSGIVVGDRTSIINLEVTNFRYGIVVGWEEYFEYHFPEFSDAVAALNLQNATPVPLCVYISSIHVDGVLDYPDTAAVVARSGGRLYIDLIVSETMVKYGILQLPGFTTVGRVQGFIAEKVRMYATGSVLGADPDQWEPEGAMRCTILHGFKYLYKIPAGTTLAAGKNVFTIQTNYTYKGKIAFRAWIVSEPEIPIRVYAIDNDNNNPNELQIIVYNDSGTSYTLTKDLLIFIESAF